MKKHNFLAKVASLFLAALLAFGAVPAYAMEGNVTQNGNVSIMDCDTEEVPEGMVLLAHGTSDDGVIDFDVPITRAGNDQFSYAQTVPVGGFTCVSSNLTPVKSVVNDARIHRLVVKVKFRKSLQDRGVGAIRLNLYLRRYGTTQNIPMGLQDGINECNSTQVGALMQTNWMTVSPGEHFQFYFDVVSADSSTANGNVRIAEIEEYWVYCD